MKSLFNLFRGLRPPKDRSLAKLVAWDPLHEREVEVRIGERWELDAYALRMNRDHREYRVDPLEGQGMSVFVVVAKDRAGGPRDFCFEKMMQPRYWHDEIEARGALAAFEHQNPEIEGRFAVRPALIRYTP